MASIKLMWISVGASPTSCDVHSFFEAIGGLQLSLPHNQPVPSFVSDNFTRSIALQRFQPMTTIKDWKQWQRTEPVNSQRYIRVWFTLFLYWACTLGPIPYITSMYGWMEAPQDVQTGWTGTWPQWSQGYKSWGASCGMPSLSSTWSKPSWRLAPLAYWASVCGFKPLIPQLTEPRYLFYKFVATDANFRLRNKLVSSQAKNPTLGDGFAYFVPYNDYIEWVKRFVDQAEVMKVICLRNWNNCDLIDQFMLWFCCHISCKLEENQGASNNRSGRMLLWKTWILAAKWNWRPSEGWEVCNPAQHWKI